MSSSKVPIESSDDSSSSEEEDEEDHKEQEESGPRNDMADYSIGDRVEVKWQSELFDASVIKVNPSGSVDVVYDIDGSVGIFLTVKEHELNWGGTRKKVDCAASTR